MKYVYAALLLHSAGKPVDEDGVKKVLTAAGIKVEEARVKSLIASLSEVKIDEAIKSASAVVAAPAAAAPSAAPPASPSAKKEQKKPEEEKKKEEEALAGLGALFGS